MPQAAGLSALSFCIGKASGMAQSAGSVWIGRCPCGHGAYQSSRQAACLRHFPDVGATALAATRRPQYSQREGLKWLGSQCKGKRAQKCFALIRRTNEKSSWRIEYSLRPLKLETILLPFLSSPAYWWLFSRLFC